MPGSNNQAKRPVGRPRRDGKPAGSVPKASSGRPRGRPRKNPLPAISGQSRSIRCEVIVLDSNTPCAYPTTTPCVSLGTPIPETYKHPWQDESLGIRVVHPTQCEQGNIQPAFLMASSFPPGFFAGNYSSSYFLPLLSRPATPILSYLSPEQELMEFRRKRDAELEAVTRSAGEAASRAVDALALDLTESCGDFGEVRKF